ncbi:helix-turn-helix domain-containing protein [Phreatobacter sp. HK31-P]
MSAAVGLSPDDVRPARERPAAFARPVARPVASAIVRLPGGGVGFAHDERLKAAMLARRRQAAMDSDRREADAMEQHRQIVQNSIASAAPVAETLVRERAQSVIRAGVSSKAAWIEAVGQTEMVKALFLVAVSDDDANRLHRLLEGFTSFTRYLCLKRGIPVDAVINTTRLARMIVEHVAERRGVTPADIYSRICRREVSRARQEVCFLLRKHTRWSYPGIGRFLGGRDHTTVLHGVRTYTGLVLDGREKDIGEMHS